MATVPSKYRASLIHRRNESFTWRIVTILTNKAAKGGNGSIVAIVAGTKAETVIEIIRKMPESLRKKVTEITLDMAGSMTMIAKRCFPRLHASQTASMYKG